MPRSAGHDRTLLIFSVIFHPFLCREPSSTHNVISRHGRFAMQTILGMILGALLLVACVYLYDSIQTSNVANGQVAQSGRTIVNWDVAQSDWNKLKTRAHEDWVKISSK
jgi:hypothetical protein